MYTSDELFQRSQEGYFSVYFPSCEATKEMNTKIILEWAQKQFVTKVHKLLYFLHDVANPQMTIKWRYSTVATATELNERLNSQKTPHNSPLRASYGVSLFGICEEIDRIIRNCTVYLFVIVKRTCWRIIIASIRVSDNCNFPRLFCIRLSFKCIWIRTTSVICNENVGMFITEIWMYYKQISTCCFSIYRTLVLLS